MVERAKNKENAILKNDLDKMVSKASEASKAKSKKISDKENEELIRNLAKDIAEEGEEKMEEERKEGEGIERAILPSRQKMERFVSKVASPEPLGIRKPARLEESVAFVPRRTEEDGEESKKQVSYDTRKPYETAGARAGESPGAKGTYVVEGRGVTLQSISPMAEERTSKVGLGTGAVGRGDIPEHFLKPMQRAVYETQEQKQVYSSDVLERTKEPESYVAFKKEKRKTMEEFR